MRLIRRRHRHEHDWEVVEKTLVEGMPLRTPSKQQRRQADMSRSRRSPMPRRRTWSFTTAAFAARRRSSEC